MKIFNIILGAGFSKGMAKLPISSEIDELIFKDSQLKELYDYLKNEDTTHNFETIMQQLISYRDCRSIKNFFHRELSDAESIKVMEDLFSKISQVLPLVLDIRYEDIDTQLNSLFIEFLGLLVHEYKFYVNVFDLNFDNVFELAVKNSNLQELYYDFYDVSTENSNTMYFNYPMAELINNPYTINTSSSFYRESNYSSLMKSYYDKELEQGEIESDLEQFKQRRIFHYKLHGSLYEYFGYGQTELEQLRLFKDNVCSNVMGAERFYITGGNKFRHLKDHHTGLLFRILKIYSSFDTLTIGYSFNDPHVEFMANVSVENQSGRDFSPIQFFCKNRPSKENRGTLICEIDNLIKKNNHKDFYLKNFLSGINLNDQR
jgi:hypothetical protein